MVLVSRTHAGQRAPEPAAGGQIALSCVGGAVENMTKALANEEHDEPRRCASCEASRRV